MKVKRNTQRDESQLHIYKRLADNFLTDVSFKRVDESRLTTK